MALRQLRLLLFTPRYLAIIAGIGGLFGVGVATVVPNPYTYMVPPALLVAVVFYLTLQAPSCWPSISTDPRFIATGYFLLLSITLISQTTTSQPVGRPWMVHFSIAGMYVLSVLYITTPVASRTPLAFLSATAAVHRVLAHYSSALNFSFDSLFHVKAAAAVAEQGELSVLLGGRIAESKYFYTPLYYLISAPVEHVAGVTARDAGFLAGGVAITIGAIFLVYALATRLVDSNTAVVAAALFVTSDYVVRWGILPRQQIFGVFFFGFMLWSYLTYRETGQPRYFLLLLVATVCQIALQQHGAFIAIAGMLAAITVGIIRDGRLPKTSANYLLILGLSIVYFWMITFIGGRSFFEYAFISAFSHLSRSGGRSSTVPDFPNYSFGASESLLLTHLLGLAILLSLGVLGMLVHLRRSERVSQQTELMVHGTIVAGMAVVVFAGPLGTFSFLQPNRWFAFMYIPLAILGAIGLRAIVGRATHRVGTVAGVVVICVVLVPFIITMGANPHGGVDEPVLGGPGADRLATTSAEKAAYLHTTEYHDTGTVYTDKIAAQIVERHYGVSSEHLLWDHSAGEYRTNSEGYILYRDYIDSQRGPFDIYIDGRSWEVRGAAPYPDDDEKIYTNGDDDLLITPDSSERTGNS